MIKDKMIIADSSAPIEANPMLSEDMGGLVVLSLFNGMSCGEIALHLAGIKIKQYYSAEIDKSAIWVTQNNYPNTIQLGDVTKVFAKDLPKIDLIIGGSPCQGFSFAGKGLNFEDPRSKLFFEFVRLVNECKPKYFLLENVKMKKEHELVISQYMKVAPIEINSALVSAQNRVRLYWTNIAQKPYGLFGDMFTDIPKQKDRGILLKDILETDVPDKYFLSDKMLAWLNTRDKEAVDINGKSGCFTAGGNSGGLHSQMDLIKVGCIKYGRTDEGKALRKQSMAKGKDHTPFQAKQITDIDFEKMNTLTTVGSKDNLVIQLNTSIESNGCQPYQQNRIYDTNGIAPSLLAQMSCGTHAILVPEATKKGFIEVQPGECFDAENINSETRRGRKMEDKSNCLMAKETDFMQYTKDFKIRRLTPTECERLQTVPDGYTKGVSDTQRYRMLGNGWTVEVIAYIFGFMKKELAESAEW